MALRAALVIRFCSRIGAIADLSGCPGQHRMEKPSKLCKPDIGHCCPEKPPEQGQPPRILREILFLPRQTGLSTYQAVLRRWTSV
jgi:hypothetical protein